jgi:hypothetical protein
MIRHRKGQFFLIIAILYCIILVSIATYVIAVISSPTMARIRGAQYVYMNVKGQCIRVVEISLANLTNHLAGLTNGTPNVLSLNLEDWKNSTRSFFIKEGFPLSLAYANALNETRWNQSLSWSKANASFTVLLQSGSSKISDVFTVRSELYVQVDSLNATHVKVSVWKEGGAPVVSATVRVGQDWNNSVQEFVNNEDGTYVTVRPSTSQYIFVRDSRSILVKANLQ